MFMSFYVQGVLRSCLLTFRGSTAIGSSVQELSSYVHVFLPFGVVRTAVFTSSGSYVQGFVRQGVLTSSGFYVQGFLHPGVLTFRDSYIQLFLRPEVFTFGGSHDEGVLPSGVLTSRGSCVHGFLSPVQTDATLLDVTCLVRLHTLLHVVGCCCAKFETGRTFEPTTPNISFVL